MKHEYQEGPKAGENFNKLVTDAFRTLKYRIRSLPPVKPLRP